MDIASHGLWGGIAFGRKNKKRFWLAFVFGILPDLLSFGIFTIATFLGISERPEFRNGPPDPSRIPQYIYTLYDLTHSLITFLVIFAVLWIIFRKPIWEFCAWGLHILMDIGTHSTAFFPTPFLWPFSDFRVNGIPWSHPIIMIPNIILLIVIYSWWYFLKKKKQENFK
jgi:hypothetical protein